MPKSGESTRVDTITPVMARVDRALDTVGNTDIAARMAAQVARAITPREATAYAPGQKRRRPPLTSDLHFGTVAQLRARQEVLARWNLSPAMAKVQRQWGAVYTAALYADTTKRQAALHAELVKLAVLVAAAQKSYAPKASQKSRAPKAAKKKGH